MLLEDNRFFFFINVTPEFKFLGSGLDVLACPVPHRYVRPGGVRQSRLALLFTGRMLRTVDERSDLYSLGVIFYEMLADRLPFMTNNLLEWV
ncbi:hypothetical protein [Paenibacillus sp. N3.4]|uniref:hypothetical protein n=1 Tax=Paenibacillus sp. N3.4 TaxID=2603222 RepID=UPI0011C965A8|nr:hypothetical protein [Paenibacillus sp. N3.4]TXK84433.1 hypothetical protein FU659_08375 [Paenibacillus sp. N3.4]